MKKSFNKGLSYGTTSGVITTLGLLIGIGAGTDSRLAALSGILVIAFADAMSDALGIHISEESEGNNPTKSVWISTVATFATKLIIALSFIIPVLLFPMTLAVSVAIAWGVLLMTLLSYRIALSNKMKPATVIAEHMSITVVVIIASYYIGTYANKLFQ